MFNILFHLGFNILALLLLSNILPNFDVSGVESAFWYVAILSLVNWTLVPIAKILAFPITLLTLGLFSFVINVIAVWGVSNYVDGIDITGEISAKIITLVIISMVLSLASSFGKNMAKEATN